VAERARVLISVAGVVLLAIVAAARAEPTISDLVRHLPERRLSAHDRATAGGRAVGVNADFVEWVRARSGPRATYWLAQAAARADAAVEQWVTYRMLPRRLAPSPADAAFLVWYGQPGSRPDVAGFGRPVVYAPGLMLARRGGGG
jgi:hypothetical protein